MYRLAVSLNNKLKAAGINERVDTKNLLLREIEGQKGSKRKLDSTALPEGSIKKNRPDPCKGKIPLPGNVFITYPIALNETVSLLLYAYN